MEVCLTPLEMACIEESIGLAIKDTYALERLVWTFEKNLLPEIYRDNLKNWMLDVHFCGAYLHDRAARDKRQKRAVSSWNKPSSV